MSDTYIVVRTSDGKLIGLANTRSPGLAIEMVQKAFSLDTSEGLTAMRTALNYTMDLREAVGVDVDADELFIKDAGIELSPLLDEDEDRGKAARARAKDGSGD